MIHIIRTRSGGTVEVELTRSRAIKAFCTECLGWGEVHPKDCTAPLCPLFPYRGKIQLAYEEVKEDDLSNALSGEGDDDSEE